MKKLIAICLVLSAVAGCAAFNRLVNEHEFTLQLATEAAVARVLHEHPSWTGKTVSITAAAMRMIAAGAVTDIRSVESYIKDHVRWTSMLPEEQALVSALISEVRKNLEDALRARNITDPGLQLIEVNKVLGWINETARRTP